MTDEHQNLQFDFEVTFKEKDATLVVRQVENDEEVFVGCLEGKKKKLLELRFEDDDIEEIECHDDLDYDFDEVREAILGALGIDIEEEDDEDEEEAETEDKEEKKDDGTEHKPH